MVLAIWAVAASIIVMGTLIMNTLDGLKTEVTVATARWLIDGIGQRTTDAIAAARSATDGALADLAGELRTSATAGTTNTGETDQRAPLTGNS